MMKIKNILRIYLNEIFRGRNKFMKNNFIELKNKVKHMSDCYKKCLGQLLYKNYSNSQFDMRQEMNDLDYVSFVHSILEQCPKRSSQFLQANYFSDSDEKLYYQSLSRTTVYRIHKKAVEDFCDCLNM